MVAFNKAKGEAQKKEFNQYQYKMGENRVRLVGDLLPRYLYWIDGENNKKIPMECLSFDREVEKFINREKDWVKEFYPDQKCGWSYVMQCIDPEDGEVKVLNLKKKLFQQIQDLANDELGDPTDPETGWDVVFERKKTGPNVFNVEYTIQPFKCQKAKRPLTEEEKAKVEAAEAIEVLLPRPTPDAQKALLERLTSGSAATNTDESTVADEFDVS